MRVPQQRGLSGSSISLASVYGHEHDGAQWTPLSGIRLLVSRCIISCTQTRTRCGQALSACLARRLHRALAPADRVQIHLGGVSSIVEESLRESSCELVLTLCRVRRVLNAQPTCTYRLLSHYESQTVNLTKSCSPKA